MIKLINSSFQTAVNLYKTKFSRAKAAITMNIKVKFSALFLFLIISHPAGELTSGLIKFINENFLRKYLLFILRKIYTFKILIVQREFFQAGIFFEFSVNQNHPSDIKQHYREHDKEDYAEYFGTFIIV